MNAFIILVSNGPTVVVSMLNPEKTVSNLIWRGFRDFNLYRVSEVSIDKLIADVGKRAWENTLEELNDEWPVRVVDRDSSRAFYNFQLLACDKPVAKIRDRKRIPFNE